MGKKGKVVKIKTTPNKIKEVVVKEKVEFKEPEKKPDRLCLLRNNTNHNVTICYNKKYIDIPPKQKIKLVYENIESIPNNCQCQFI